jgi:hypothetical protein
MSSSRAERRIVVVSKELAEKIDLQRGDLSRAEFIESCIDLCLRSGGLERQREVSREEVEDLKRDVAELREKVAGRLEAVNRSYERLYQLMEALEKQMRARTPVSFPPEARAEERVSKAGLVLLRWGSEPNPSIRARYPEDWTWKTRINEETLAAIYALTLISRSQTERLRLELKSSKVAFIAAKGDSILLLVLNPDQDFKDYEEEIEVMAEEVKNFEDWEEGLPEIYEKYLTPSKHLL